MLDDIIIVQILYESWSGKDYFWFNQPDLSSLSLNQLLTIMAYLWSVMKWWCCLRETRIRQIIKKLFVSRMKPHNELITKVRTNVSSLQKKRVKRLYLFSVWNLSCPPPKKQKNNNNKKQSKQKKTKQAKTKKKRKTRITFSQTISESL